MFFLAFKYIKINFLEDLFRNLGIKFFLITHREICNVGYGLFSLAEILKMKILRPSLAHYDMAIFFFQGGRRKRT